MRSASTGSFLMAAAAEAGGPAMAPRRARKGRVGLYLVALFFAFYAAFPFAWSLVTAFKRDSDLYRPANNPFLFNRPPTLKHFSFLFSGTSFVIFLYNTAVVALVVVLITLALSLPAAYALARLKLRWAPALLIGIFFVYLVPPSLLFISLSKVVVALGLQDSMWALVVVYPTTTIPLSVWLLTGFFKSIPKDIEEQAMVDGYSRLSAFLRTQLPLIVPGVVAVTVFSGTLAAGEFIYALSFVSQSVEKTVSVGVPTELIRGDIFFWQPLQAATILVAAPLALLFNAFFKKFLTGLSLGAVKG